MVNSPCTQAISNDAMEMSYGRVSLPSFLPGWTTSSKPTSHASPTLALPNGMGFGVALLWSGGGNVHWVKSQLIVVEGNMTAVRYRDEILPTLQSLSCSNVS